MSSFLSFILFLFYSSLLSNAKFYFNFQSNPLKLPTCSLSGVKTVHLPDSSSDPLNFRLHFPSKISSSPINFEAFSSSAQRIFRLELTLLHGHIQINWNGLLSSWQLVKEEGENENYLEIKLLPGLNHFHPQFKLNGKMVSVEIPEPVNRPTVFKLTYDDTAVPDSDWLELFADPEILNSLQTAPPQWQAPLLSAEPIEQEQIAVIDPPSLVDYIVYNCESFTRLQISSGPKVNKKFNLPSQWSFSKWFSFFKKSSPLPIAYKSKVNNRIFGTIVISAFIVYLAILLHLSKMTSIRPNIKKSQPEQSTKQNQQQQEQSFSASQSQSRSLSQSQLKLPTTVNPFKSPSRTILIDLPDAPLFKTSPVLKVTVPAALSLADNRHILFPSKLRK